MQSPNRIEKGGLSGKPIKQKALETLRFIYEKTDGAIPIIGVGGISDANGTFVLVSKRFLHVNIWII